MGQDIQGMAGFHDQVDNHYKRLIGSALLTSAFVAGISLSQRQNSSLLTTPSVGQTAASAVATLRRANVPYFRIYDLRSTYATRLSAGGVADEWVTQLLRQAMPKCSRNTHK